jgi:hypothetical protein
MNWQIKIMNIVYNELNGFKFNIDNNLRYKAAVKTL